MRKLLLVTLALLVILFGCKKSEVIDNNDQDLTDTMKNFFAAKYDDYVKGDHFQVKLLSLAKVYYEDKVIYKYSIVIAPMLDERMNIYGFSLSLDDEAQKYYQEGGLTSYDSFAIQIYDKGDLPVKSGKDDMHAYRIETYLDNRNNETQKDYGYTEEDFDSLLSKINVTIKYNNKKETLSVSAHDIIVVKCEQDIPDGRIDLYHYLTDGVYQEGLAGTFSYDTWGY